MIKIERLKHRIEHETTFLVSGRRFDPAMVVNGRGELQEILGKIYLPFHVIGLFE